MSSRPQSLRARFLMMSALSSTLALALACSGFLAYDVLTFRQTLVDDLTSDAEVLAFNLVAPLLFDDASTAHTSLEALRAKPNIRGARVVEKDGTLFAAYGDTGATSPLGPGAFTHSFEDDRLWLRMPVMSEGALIGTVFLDATLEAHQLRIRRFLLLSAGLLFISLLAAIGVSGWMQRRILQPILSLTQTADWVSRNRDFSVRVEAHTADELGVLNRTFNDMLEQIERQNTELTQAVRLRDEFLAVASHELKTPLTSLQLQVQVLTLQARREETDWVHSRVAVLDRQVRRLGRLVDDLLDISRLSIRKFELSYEQVDLSELITHVVEQYESEASRKGCDLKLTVPGPVVGRWDAARLEQVVVNLVSNALKYGVGAPIELAVIERDGLAVFSVQDHGIGIASEDLERIFDRYERAVSDRHYGGFGLGLWIVREIVRSLGGTVRVESQPGEGARFEVSLPLGDRAEAAASRSTGAPQGAPDGR